MSCSQEDHAPNCGHFGYAGTYLSEHLKTCPCARSSGATCNCNPRVRDHHYVFEDIRSGDRITFKNDVVLVVDVDVQMNISSLRSLVKEIGLKLIERPRWEIVTTPLNRK